MKPQAVAAAGGGAAVMKGDDSTMMSDDMKSDAKTRGHAPAARSDAPPTTMPAIGTMAPQFSIHKLDGSLLTLSSLKGRVVVLEFGSYSCPSFRRRVPAMEQMKHEFGTKAQLFVIYAKEAHPTGEWDVDRNKDEGISIEQPGSADARRQIAQGARDKLKITVPVALDTMDNEVAKMYGAGANSAVVIDRDGRIAAHQEWFEPVALRKYIDAAAKATVSATRAAAAD